MVKNDVQVVQGTLDTLEKRVTDIQERIDEIDNLDVTAIPAGERRDAEAGKVWVNHMHDDMARYTCDEVGTDNPCLADGFCMPEPLCPYVDGKITK
jgi:hypothetical protein